MYKIAFLWYSFLGAIIMWIVCLAVSHLTGGEDLKEFNVNLLAPIAQYFVPKKYRLIELQSPNEKNTINEIDKPKAADTTKWVWRNPEHTNDDQEKDQTTT